MEADLRSRFFSAIGALEAAVPDVKFDLAAPANESQIGAVESVIGFRLPPELRALYLIHDGQPEMSHGLFGGLPFLPLERAVDQWLSWRDNDSAAAESYSSVPLGAVQEKYTDPGWFPFTNDGGGNCLAVDTVPGATGTFGQVVNFGRDEFERFAYAPSLIDYFELIVSFAIAGRARVSDDPEWASWGIDTDDGGWPDYSDFAEADAAGPERLSDEAWFESLDDAWKLYIGDVSNVPSFSAKTKLYSFQKTPIPLPTTTLEPLARASGLRELILYTQTLDSLYDLPALTDLRVLQISTMSIDGIDRFPALREFSGSYGGDGESPQHFLAPLAALPRLAILHIGPEPYDLTPLSGCTKLKNVTIRLANAAQFGQLSLVAKLTELSLDASRIPQTIDELDWSAVPNVTRLTITNGRISSFHFVAGLTRLIELDAWSFEAASPSIDVSAIAALPKIRHVNLSTGNSARSFAAVEAFANTPSLESFSAGFDAFDALKELRPDLPFRSMEGRLTDEQSEAWSAWLRRGR